MDRRSYCQVRTFTIRSPCVMRGLGRWPGRTYSIVMDCPPSVFAPTPGDPLAQASVPKEHVGPFRRLPARPRREPGSKVRGTGEPKAGRLPHAELAWRLRRGCGWEWASTRRRCRFPSLGGRAGPRREVVAGTRGECPLRRDRGAAGPRPAEPRIPGSLSHRHPQDAALKRGKTDVGFRGSTVTPMPGKRHDAVRALRSDTYPPKRVRISSIRAKNFSRRWRSEIRPG